MICILCKKREFILLYTLDKYKILKCKNCGLVTTKQPKNANYTKYHRDDAYLKFESHFANMFRKRFNLINRFTSNKSRVCDIGCSTGTMLDIFKNSGWETWGVEPSKSADIAKKKGHKIINTILEDAKLPKNYFDAVVLNHTLEHVENPVQVLQKVFLILKRDGVVLVDVPNFGSLSSRLQKSKWALLLPQEHTYHFTFDTLEQIFNKANFNAIHIESRSGLYEFSNPWAEIIESLLTLKKRFFTNILGLPGSTISTVLNKGNSMSMVGRKI